VNGHVTSLQNPLIAIVDDDVSVRISTRRLVSAFGFRAQTFASAWEFLDSNRRTETACLILDLRMPDLDGLDLQRCLARDKHRRLPIIFVTANAGEEEQRLAIKTGAVDFLRKPVSEQALFDAIEKALRQNFNLGRPHGESALND
jgi:FixJ family two-component response regulator